MNITNSNLADAYKIAQAHKAFKKTFNQAPPQTKAFISFMIPLVLGFLIYSFVKTPATQLIVFSIITVIIGGLLYSFTDNYAESWAMSMSFLIITLFWFYIFYNKYQKQQEDDEVGKKHLFVNRQEDVTLTEQLGHMMEEKHIFLIHLGLMKNPLGYLD